MLTGTQKGFDDTFGSTCHGAVSSVTPEKSLNRATYFLCRAEHFQEQNLGKCNVNTHIHAHTHRLYFHDYYCVCVCVCCCCCCCCCRRTIGYEDVLEKLQKKGISIRVASPKLVMEEVYIYMYNYLAPEYKAHN